MTVTSSEICELCQRRMHDGICGDPPAKPVPADTRPRVPYVLPDGTIGMFIFDHGDRVPDTITFQPAGGAPVVELPLSTTYIGPRVLP